MAAISAATNEPTPPVTTARGANQAGNETCFHFAELRTSHEENHVNGRHAAAQFVRRCQLPNGLPQYRADSTTPPTSEHNMIGRPLKKPTIPRANADLVSR